MAGDKGSERFALLTNKGRRDRRRTLSLSRRREIMGQNKVENAGTERDSIFVSLSLSSCQSVRCLPMEEEGGVATVTGGHMS